ncbi:MAG: RNB domain-containing ribonuclease [Solirubrobacterales bacterium]
MPRPPMTAGGPRVAVVEKKGRFTVAELLFERGERLSLGGGRKARPGEMVLVQAAKGRGDRAKVLRSLGDPGRARDVIDALMLDRGLRRGFPAKLETAAREAAKEARGDAADRRDLTGLHTFTVDPVTARDFDDAVSAKAEGDGVRLWIHIADVAAHVRPGSALEAEAHRRATSTYVPGSVEPMLPTALSNEACSLVPGEERLAVTTEIELSGSGDVRGTSFYRSRIRSDARFSYEQIDDYFRGRKRPPGEVAEPLALTRRAAAALTERRGRSGLEVHTPEPDYEFEAGDVVAAVDVEQTEAHRLIEMLMVLTNEQVAELLERKKVPSLYRVHEQPDPEAIEALLEKLAALGVPTPPLPEKISPKQASELAAEASRLAAAEARRRGHGREAYTSLVLRSMKQAHYADRNLGHAGLASPAYCHFTSPIRRFPDLVCHRGLLSVTGGGEKAPRAERLSEAAAHCSELERDAMKLERGADDVCAAFLLERERVEAGPGTAFEGEVNGLVGAGAFVRFAGELSTTYEGFLPARRIGGRERYDLDATETALVGGTSGGRLRLGDPVKVLVDKVDAPRGRVDLLPVDG